MLIDNGQLSTWAEAVLDEHISAYKTGSTAEQAEYARLKTALVAKFTKDLNYFKSYAKVSIPIDTTGALATAFTSALVAAGDGGATLKTNMAAAVTAGYGTAEQDGSNAIS
jgi:hypothetical protein